MVEEGSVTLWLRLVRDGDEAGVQQLWHRYFNRLVALARGKLQGAPCRAEDAEDAALSAFDSFCRGAEQGRFPRLGNRDDLWRLLVMITARKAYDLAEREGRLKRGGDKVHVDPTGLWESIAGNEPTPEFAAQAAEEYRRLLSLLADAELRSIAIWKMEGLTNQEIAARLDCAIPTVERRLRRIRKTWSAASHEPEA
jgi:RNA polymerase sigma factor (sigma-70 family)